MMLTAFRLMNKNFPHKHLGALFEELLVLMVIRQQDEFGGNGPTTISGITRKLNVPRSNVSRAVAGLVRQGIIEKVGRGYRGRMDYLAPRVEAAYWKGIVKAVTDAADDLRE
jgi:DNA-binding MarR family transcriptional regulator